MRNIVTNLQPIGRALMLPIAVLPAAALLLRLGQPDLLNIAAVAAAGNAIFSNLGLLFAIGVAVGWWPCMPAPSGAYVQLNGDGSATIVTGAQECGTGSVMALPILAAEVE